MSQDEHVRKSLRASGRVKLRASEQLASGVVQAARLLSDCFRAGGRAYIAGNGGSAGDAQHFAAEFTGRFRHDRQPLPVMSLTTDASALTAIANDYAYTEVFARQLRAFGQPGEVFFALSTSGKSENIVNACRMARSVGLSVISMTGARSGPLEDLSDIFLRVPSGITAEIQECSMALLHAICDSTERLLGLSEGGADEIAEVELATETLALQGEAWRRAGVRVVTTNGCFDALHAGHVWSLQRAAEFGDVLVVLLNSDASVRRLKGETRPLHGERARVAVLGALCPVDHVVVFGEDTPTNALSLLKPAVHCKGEEHRDARPLPEEDVVLSNGGRMEFVPRLPGLSSSAIISHQDRTVVS